MYLYCTSLVLYIWLNGPLYLLSLNALTRLLRLQATEWENDEPCEQSRISRTPYPPIGGAMLSQGAQNSSPVTT